MGERRPLYRCQRLNDRREDWKVENDWLKSRDGYVHAALSSDSGAFISSNAAQLVCLAKPNP